MNKITTKMDGLGRIVMPKKLREDLEINVGR